MGGIIGLLLLTVLCSSVNTVRGTCVHVKNDDLIEYSCVGGELSDLDSLPASTGKIRISNMPITRITKDTFGKFGSDLWVLGCSHCGIRDIEPGAFQRLDNLQQLSLDNNYLSNIKASWFSGLTYLTYLDLNYNNIETIEDGVFQTLPNLVDLRLSGNRLECLNLQDMSNLKELKRIFLTENPQFKCPNAVSTFLENHDVNFEKDTQWDRIPEDLVLPEVSYDYDDYYDTTTPRPAYRERLHLVTTTTPPPPPPETSPPYLSPRFQTTEDVVYHPAYHIPDWRTTTTPPEEESPYEESSYEESPYEEQGIGIYTPPRTIAPLETDRNSQITDDMRHNVAEVTSRPWPIRPEETNVNPEYPPNPPYGNEDELAKVSASPDEAPTPLEASPIDRHEVPFYEESNRERTTESHTSNQQHMYPSIQTNVHPDFTDPPIIWEPTQPQKPFSRAPMVQNVPILIQSPTSDNSYQAPYYEYPVTVHPPPPQPVYPAVATMDVTMTTTTDKPLPNCPSSSSPIQRSVELIVFSILMVFVRNVFVEGF